MARTGAPHRLRAGEHVDWVATRLMLDRELHEWSRHATTLIAAGFGSFALFEGVHVGEGPAADLPRDFVLAATAAGVLMVLSAVRHDLRMTRWIDEEEFGEAAVPALPDERRPLLLGLLVGVVGVVSFVALLRLPA